MPNRSVSTREDINRSNVFISWTGADENIKSDIARYLKDRNLTVCESDAECAGNFMQWSVEAAVKSGVFLLVLTKNLVANEKSVARQEIKAWKALFKDGEDYANRTVVVCSDLALLGEFTDENGVPYIAAADCLSCETFDIEKGLTERNLQNIYNKTVKLIVGRMSRIYADKSASGRSIDITRLLGVDLLDTEKTKVDFDKIYIPRSLKFDDKIYYRVKALADDTNNNVLFITAKAGSGKSCFIGQIINEYKNIDGAIVLTATCPEAAKYCIANVYEDEKYPVLLQYLFKKFIETCKIGESFYTIDNFASLICDKIDGGKDVVIALDAMDEIALQDNTRAFVGHVEELQEFCGNKVKIIVTDRGQTAAKMFDGAYVCELQEFSDDNVNEYCDKLFGFLEERSLTNKKLSIDVSYLKDKVKCLSKDIKRNPFMLTQVVSLYALTGNVNDSEIGMLDDITDVMFKSERLKVASTSRKVMPSNIVEMLSEFAYIRQVTLSKGRYMTRSLAVKIFDRLLRESGEMARSGLTGEELTEYIVFREFYNFRENKFFHERYGEYLTARYFCDKVLDEFGNVFDNEKLNELLSRCGDKYWTLVINMFVRRSAIKSIVLPDTLTSIGGGTFYKCKSLKKVTIPKGVISIGKCAFWKCSSLMDLNMPDTLTIIEEGAFCQCTSLEKIIIPKGVIGIGKSVFRECSSLKYLKMPNTLTDIGKRAFYGCSSLKEIKMPDSLTDIGEQAFYNCTSLEKVTIPKGVKSIGQCAFDGCNLLKEVTICEGVKSIGNWAFDGCSSLKEIKMPDSLTDIGERAFYNCTSLEKVTIPKGVKSISRSTFYGCSSLVEIKMPDSLTDIGERAFYNCTSLEKVTIPKGVTSIEKWTFSKCGSLKSIKMPDTLTSIGDLAFYECTSLEKVTIPKGVMSLGKWAFDGCSSLKEVTICEGVKRIENGVFYKCTSLEKVTIPKGVISIGQCAFNGCCALIAIYFVNTKGWRAGNDEISPDDLSDPAKAAYLLSGKYARYKWERS